MDRKIHRDPSDLFCQYSIPMIFSITMFLYLILSLCLFNLHKRAHHMPNLGFQTRLTHPSPAPFFSCCNVIFLSFSFSCSGGSPFPSFVYLIISLLNPWSPSLNVLFFETREPCFSELILFPLVILSEIYRSIAFYFINFLFSYFVHLFCELNLYFPGLFPTNWLWFFESDQIFADEQHAEIWGVEVRAHEQAGQVW